MQKNAVKKTTSPLSKKIITNILLSSSVFLCAFSPSIVDGTSKFSLLPNSKVTTAALKVKLPSQTLKVGFVTDETGIINNSLNQAANLGFKRAVKDFRISYKPIESDSIIACTSNMSSLAKCCNMIFGVGFSMSDSIERTAEKYPNLDFCIVDTTVELPNVASIIFREEEGSFLMGVIAGKSTKTNKIAFIGSMDFPLINKYEAGFAAGVKAVNPEAAKNLLSRKTVAYADSFHDLNRGYELATDFYSDNCDIIYQVAGETGIGIMDAAKDLKDSGKQVYTIGADEDFALTYPKYSSVILSSMVKNIDKVVYSQIKSKVNRTFKTGKVLNLGLKEDGLSISPSSVKKLPKTITTLLTKYTTLIKTKKLRVPNKVIEYQK